MKWILAVRKLRGLPVVIVGLGLILPITASAQQQKPTIASLNELGAEGSILTREWGSGM